MLTLLFLLRALLPLAIESDDNDSDESYNDGSGSGFTSGSFFSLLFELSIDRVILLLSSRVIGLKSKEKEAHE